MTTSPVEVILFFVILGALLGWINYRKGNEWPVGAAAALLGPLGIILVLAGKKNLAELDRRKAASGYLRCPHCWELIQHGATICPHCHASDTQGTNIIKYRLP